MRESFWGYWLILLGVFVIVIMMLVSNVTTTNTQDYYLIKEVTEQAMVDAVDLAYYRQSGELRMNAEKFYESLIRRFAENVVLNNYQIDVYGVYEAPPKASVKVITKSASYNIGTDSSSFDIVNKIDAILETDGFSGEGMNTSNSDKAKPTSTKPTIDSDFANGEYDSSNTTPNKPGTSKPEETFNPHNPSGSDIAGLIVAGLKDKYYDCSSGGLASRCHGTTTFKNIYSQNGKLFETEAVKDWEKKYSIKFTNTERKSFINKLHEEFTFVKW